MRPATLTKTYFVYILASQRNGTLYIGVTNDVMRRAWEHKQGQVAGFTKKYGVNLLVYYEAFEDIEYAIAREKQLKKWNRAWKLRLIEEKNPECQDLYEALALLESTPSSTSPTVPGAL
jgi:putative endonuclease